MFHVNKLSVYACVYFQISVQSIVFFAIGLDNALDNEILWTVVCVLEWESILLGADWSRVGAISSAEPLDHWKCAWNSNAWKTDLLKCIWNEMGSEVKGNLFLGMLLLLFINSYALKHVVFNDWLFNHEWVIFHKGVVTTLLHNLWDNRLIGKAPWCLEWCGLGVGFRSQIVIPSFFPLDLLCVAEKVA